jgi:hypothetical protein
MNSQQIRNLQEAYLGVYNDLDEATAPGVEPYEPRKRNPLPKEKPLSGEKGDGSGYGKPRPDGKDPLNTNNADYKRFGKGLPPKPRPFGRPFGKYDPGTIELNDILKKLPKGKNLEIIRHTNLNNSYDLYDIILSHLLDEGYAETVEAAESIMVNMSEDWRQDIMEKEDSEYEKASDAALDSRYGYGRASGDKRSFGRAANRSSAAAALRAIRRGQRSGSGTSTEAGSDAVHQGWARTAKTSADQTPEKKERRAVLANTPYSNLPDDEKEKDRVSFNAVKAVYNNRKNLNNSYDLYDVILSHLLDEGYAETVEAAESIMVNMSEDWRESIVEEVLEEEKKSLPVSRMAKQARRIAFSHGTDVNSDEGSSGNVPHSNPTKALAKMARIGGKKVKQHIKKGYEQGSQYDPYYQELNWRNPSRNKYS